MWTARFKKLPTEGVFEFRRPTVADALGIALQEVSQVPPYHVGSEPVTKARGRRTRSGRYTKAAEVDALLEEFRPDAEAGVPDEWLGRRVGLSKYQVARWRKRQGIARNPGRRPARRQFEVLAADVFGRNPMPLVVPTDSPVDGQWEPPKYVLREPLDYGRFAELVHDLVRLGHAPATVAAGLGVRPADVEDACRLWVARQQRGAR